MNREFDDRGLLDGEGMAGVNAEMEARTGTTPADYERLVVDLMNACAGHQVRLDLLETAFLTVMAQVTGAWVPRQQLGRHVKRMAKLWLKYAAVAERNKGHLWPLDGSCVRVSDPGGSVQ